MRKHGWHSVVSLCLAFFATSAWAQTQAGGAVASDTVWRAAQGPFIIGSDIVVASGVTLTIEAGTTVYMSAGTRFIVSGVLKATGTVQAPVVITSYKVNNGEAAAPGDWQQMIFNAGSSASALQYVQVEYGRGLVVNGAAPSFNYVTIKGHQGAAMAMDLASSPLGVGNKAINNSINAVVVPEGEISGTVTWGLRGIPYLVLAGKVSVGNSPTITSLTPNSVQLGETIPVTLSGSRLGGLTQLTFLLSGVSAEVVSATDTQAQLLLSATNAAALGVTSLSALTNAGEVSFNNALTVGPTQPRLNSVDPSVIHGHQGNVGITLKGVNIASNSVAYLDATALQTTYVSSTELTAIVENQITLGNKTLTLRTPGAGAETFTSNGLTLGVIAVAPVATGVSPNALRRGEMKKIQVTGTALAGTQVTTSASGLSIANLVLTPTLASFDLSASAGASLGVQQLTVSNAAGSTTVNVSVNGAVPVVTVAPTPLAVPPDGSARQFFVRLSFADTESHTFSVATGDVATATVSVTSLTVPAGQTQVVGSITGVKAGTTALKLNSATLGELSIPLFVTPDFLGLNSTFAPLVGVVLAGGPPTVADPITVSPYSPSVGIVFGPALTGIAPKSIVVGSGPANLLVSGQGLGNAVSVAFLPADGITVGAFNAAADGKSLTVPVTVAANAATTSRQMLIMSSSGNPFMPATTDADRLLVTLPIPEVQSITPLNITPASGNGTMVIRGKRLQSASSIVLVPPGGVTFDSTYNINGDGSELTVAMSVASDIALGDRVVRVTTPAGTSDAAAVIGNTLHVVNQLAGAVTPIVSPAVGVVVASAPVESAVSHGIFTKPVGVAFGTAATGMSPRAKIVGDTFTLTVNGIGLGGVTSVSFAPATGLAVGTPVPATDGRSLTVQVSIAADAPKTARTVSLAAGATQVAFADRNTAMFNVTGMVPSISSVNPLGLVPGAAAVPMTILGQNFRDVQSVSFVPPEGISVFTPTVLDADATQLSVNVLADSNATPGARAVVVTTLAGSTSAELSNGNTVIVTANAFPTGLATSLNVGVVVQTTGQSSPPLVIDSLPAKDVGVVLASNAGSESIATPLYANPVGVTMGAVALDIAPKSWTVASSGTLTIKGKGLQGVTTVAVDPPQGIVIGALQVAQDGLQVSAPFQVASDAAPTVRRVALGDGAGNVLFSASKDAALGIYSAAQPLFSSISPPVAQPGNLLTLTILGENLKNATAVSATPANGLLFDSVLNVNAAGTEATVRVQVEASASVGERVIRLLTPTGGSTEVGGPTNILRVYIP